jgi:predicted oxidoreductase (fatty acid repression mutant protein)
MSIDHKGSQGQTQRAVVLQGEEEEEVFGMQRCNSRNVCSVYEATKQQAAFKIDTTDSAGLVTKDSRRIKQIREKFSQFQKLHMRVFPYAV